MFAFSQSRSVSHGHFPVVTIMRPRTPQANGPSICVPLSDFDAPVRRCADLPILHVRNCSPGMAPSLRASACIVDTPVAAWLDRRNTSESAQLPVPGSSMATDNYLARFQFLVGTLRNQAAAVRRGDPAVMLQMPNQAVESAASSCTSNMDCVPSRWWASGQTEGGHGAAVLLGRHKRLRTEGKDKPSD